MNFNRHQDLWKNRPNNASLIVNPTTADIQNVYSFCEHFNDRLSHFLFTCMETSKLIKTQEQAILVDTQENLSMIIQILKQQKFVFVDVISEFRTSYKGYISWLLIGTYSRLYVIDAARLHDQCFGLKQVLESKELIKFVHQCQEVMFALKRDWQIFIPNIFDLEIVQRYLAKKGKNNIQPKISLKQFLSSNANAINGRPFNFNLIEKFQEFYQNQLCLILNLDNFFTTQDPQYQCYAYFNHYEFLLKSYFHHSPSVREMDELERGRRGVNSFTKYGTHQQLNFDSEVYKENSFWLKDKQQQEIANMLCDWREHIAKMRDISGEQVLTYEALSRLAKSTINSILQISQICSSSTEVGPGIYSLSLEDLEQIFELFQLYKQQKQESIHELVIPKRLPYFKQNEQKPIKQLFQELKFNDPTNDWLNKKTDESVRLYKEIVSINQFDNSIVEEYMRQILANKNSSSLNVEDINRCVKYAEYLRLGNHKKLQELYEKSKNQQYVGRSLQEEEFEENFFQDSSYKNWDEIEEEIDFPTLDTINQPKSNQSLTSLKSLTNLGFQSNNLGIHSCKNFSNSNSTTVLKQKGLNSLRLLESPSIRLLESPSIFTKIQPLPENIEAIYLEAAKAKKLYISKGQKKKEKANKKQPKTKIQSSTKKQEEFVPKKEEIFDLIYY